MSQNIESLLISPPNLAELDIPNAVAVDIVLRLLFTEGDTIVTRLEEVLRLSFKVLDEILHTHSLVKGEVA